MSRMMPSVGDVPVQDPFFVSELDENHRPRRWERIISSRWQRWFSAVLFAISTFKAEPTLDFPATAAQTSSSLTVSIPGVQTNNRAIVVAPVASVMVGGFYDAYVSAADVVTVRFCNFSSGAQNPPSGNFFITVSR